MSRILLALLLLAPLARADEPTPDLQSLGKREFEIGRTEFNLGRYESALERFEAGYRLGGRATLLYNLGVTHRRLFNRTRKLEQLDHAIERFRAFLASPAITDAVARQRVAEDLREAEATLAAERAARARGADLLQVASNLISRGELHDAKKQIDRFRQENQPPHERAEAVLTLMMRGRLAAANNNPPAAQRFFTRALSLDRGAGAILPRDASPVERSAFAAARAALGATPVVAVDHSPPGGIMPGGSAAIDLSFRLPADPTGVVAGVDVHYRVGTGAYGHLPRTLLRTGGETRVSLPRNFVAGVGAGQRVEYFVDVVDEDGAILEHLGSRALPFGVQVGQPKKPLVKAPWFWATTVLAVGAAATAIGVGVTVGMPPPSTSVPIRLTLLSW